MIIDHNIRITKDEASQLFKEFDTNETGTLDYDEFLAKLTVYLNRIWKDLLNFF